MSETGNEFDGIDGDELYQSYQQYATEELKLERRILALQAELVEAREMKAKFFGEILRRGE